MNQSDVSRNCYMLHGPLAKQGYDWWWHSFTGYEKETNEEKAFFIEYFIINPALGGEKPILGQMADRTQTIRPSYVCIKAGTWGKDAKQLHAFYPISELKISENCLQLAVGDCSLSETRMRGNVEVSRECAEKPEYMCAEGKMQWNLSLHKKTAFNVGYGASKFFRKLNAFEMFWHAEGMKTEYSGTVILDGKEYVIRPETSYGYADKNWGKDFTSPWVWISSCHMKSLMTNRVLKKSVFDIGGGCPKVFGIPIKRKLLIDFNYEGKDYEFNFSKFWTRTRTKFDCFETEDEVVWKVITENRAHVLQLVCHCRKDEMLFINYEAPDGVKRHNRLWNGGTGYGKLYLYKKNSGKKELMDKIVFKNAGCEYGVY